MTDGQFFIYFIAAPEAVAVCTGWWACRRLRHRRARTAWIRQVERNQLRLKRRIP